MNRTAWRGALLILGLFVLLGAKEASAGKAATDPNIPGFSRVRILDIGSSDSLYPDRFKYIGKLGTVDKSGLYNISEGGIYYSGTINLDDGKGIYVYQVSVELLGSPPTTIKGKRYTGSSVRRGSWVRILELGVSDPNYANRGQIVGKLCYVGDYDLYSTSYTGAMDQFGGSVYCIDGTNYYFSYVSVELAKPKFKTKPANTPNIPLYTRVKVVDVSSTDPYASSRASVIGKEGYVSSSPLYSSGTSPSGATYYSGSVTLFDGTYAYFYQVALETFTLDAPGSFSMGPGIIPTGTKVQIQTIGPLDGYYVSRKEIEGRVGVVGATEALRLGEKGFYSGTITIDGKERTFFQVSVIPNPGGLPSLPAGVTHTAVPVGSRVRILDVSSSDSYSKDKAFVVGKEGVVINGDLSPGTSPWYSGAIRGDDGTHYYFTQVSVLTLAPPSPGSTGAGKTVAEVPATTPMISAGQEVRIIDIGPGDSTYYSSRTYYIGKTGVVSSSPLYSNGTSPTGGSYYSGTIMIDGYSYYFSQVALSVKSSP